MRKFIFNLKKINIQLFLILILIFLNRLNFSKIFNLIYKSHNLRQQEANDFCNYFGTGYIFLYQKKKFNLKKAPKKFCIPEQY